MKTTEKRVPLTFLVGETLDECIRETRKSKSEIARLLGTTPAKISDILNGRRKLTVEMAVRIARLFKTSPEYWLNMQTDQELREVLREKGPEIEAEIVPLSL